MLNFALVSMPLNMSNFYISSKARTCEEETLQSFILVNVIDNHVFIRKNATLIKTFF